MPTTAIKTSDGAGLHRWSVKLLSPDNQKDNVYFKMLAEADIDPKGLFVVIGINPLDALLLKAIVLRDSVLDLCK